MGFPIRTPVDQRFFAAPHGFSQLGTSFIAIACLGIHRTPFLTFSCMACTIAAQTRLSMSSMYYLPRILYNTILIFTIFAGHRDLQKLSYQHVKEQALPNGRTLKTSGRRSPVPTQLRKPHNRRRLYSIKNKQINKNYCRPTLP